MPRSAASAGLISTNIVCCSSASHLLDLVSSPPPSYSTNRPDDAWFSLAPGLTRRQIFSVTRRAARGVGLARLICTRCRKDVKSVLRCRSCGTLCPTSEIGAAMLRPERFCVLRSCFGGGRGILVCLTRSGILRHPPPPAALLD